MILKLLTGGLLGSVKDIIGMIFGDKAKREKYRHSEYSSLQDAYKEEWSYRAANRSWWDALWDGVNRIPRPLMAFGVFALFVLAYRDPDEFKRVMVAMQAVPEMLWWLFMAIVSFYFGGRSLDKARIKAPRLRDIKAQPRAKPEDTGNDTNTDTDTDNASINEWRAKANG